LVFRARRDASFSNVSAALLPSWVRSSLCFKAMRGPLASKFEAQLSLLIRCADAVLHQLAERLFVSYARSALPSLHHNSGRDSLLSDQARQCLANHLEEPFGGAFDVPLTPASKQ